MQRVLAPERSSVLSLRFFASAPAFALLAGAALLWRGAAAFDSRWSPALLAATHLMTLGVLTMVMIGALMQLLPVVAGVDVAWRRLSATTMHALLCCGTLLLAAAFWWSQPLLFALALTPLVLALVWLLATCGAGMWRARANTGSIMLTGIRMALCALLPTLGLGVALACAFSWPLGLPLELLTELHMLWGLLGWVGLLLIAVAYQVIPMFQVTPLYPPRLMQALGWTLLSLMLAGSAARLAGHWSLGLLHTMLLAGFALFAAVTLMLLARRKRPAPDATTRFWRMAMASLLGCTALWFSPFDPITRSLLLGVLFLLGFAYSAVLGMLYKIVPFLLWHHWQEQGLARPVPSIRLLIPEGRATAQFWSHAGAVVLLALAVLWPQELARPAALALLASSALLAANLARAFRLHAAY
ncbi:MAG: permease [Telluria sp.]|nr:permease [Telluria sp.]